MMDNEKLLTLYLVTVLTISFLGIAFVSGTNISKVTEKNIDIKKELPLNELKQSYTEHSTFDIEGNTDLNNTAQSEGWPGDGSENDPYIIEEYQIDGMGEACFKVYDTTDHFIIKNCYFHNGTDGVFINNVTDGILKDNIATSNSDSGLCMGGENYNNTFVNNTVHLNEDGIQIDNVDNQNFIIDNNVTSNNDEGIFLRDSSKIKISDNRVTSSVSKGIYLENSNDIAISNNTLLNNYDGIYLTGSDNNIIRNNSAHNNDNGININLGQSNIIDNNNCSSNDDGIYVSDSNHDIISNNTIYHTAEGLSLSSCSHTDIYRNVIAQNSKEGIRIAGSIDIELKNNVMKGNSIYLLHAPLLYWNTHSIDESNTVNGKPVCYWKNKTDGTISKETGQVILANCTGITVENQDISDGTIGILLGHSDGNTISNNFASSNLNSGIMLLYSNSNTVANNNLSSNKAGMVLMGSEGNNIVKNYAYQNKNQGIFLYTSNKNRVYHNNIINNGNQSTDNGNNYWNASYPTGGNYFSDYSGEDQYSGLNQDQSGSDGIGDTNYSIGGGNNADEYPLMEPWGTKPQHPPDQPSNPSPVDGASEVSTSPTLSVDISDPDGDDMNVTFNNASDDSEIGVNSGINNGTTSITWGGLSEGTTYEWYAVADDGQNTTRSSTWSFTTLIGNSPPDEPTNPSPPDGATSVSTSPSLSVYVSDPDGGNLEVSFYNAANDNLIGSDKGVSSGDTAKVNWTGLSVSTVYQWYAVVSDSEFENKSSTWSFTTQAEMNHPPEKPTNPSPSDGSTDLSTSPTVSVLVSDPDGDNMDVTFYDANDDSVIGTVDDLNSGDTASVPWSGLSANTTYEWYAVASDSDLENKSSIWSFTTQAEMNHPPEAPINPTPPDQAVDVSNSPSLSVYVSDPDGDNMDINFYDASDDSLIGTDSEVSSGDTASITLSSLSEGSTYEWYALADDGLNRTTSTTWSFTTLSQGNNPPDKPTNPSPANDAIDVTTSPILRVEVVDLDDDDMNVTFYDWTDDSLIGEDVSISSGNTASVTWSGLSMRTAYQWYAVADDGTETTASDVWSFTTEVRGNNPPDVPTNPSIPDGYSDVSTEPILSINVSDPDGGTLDVTFYDASNEKIIGIDNDVHSGQTASVSWSGLSKETTYDWYVIVSDGKEEITSSTFSFTTEKGSSSSDNEDSSGDMLMYVGIGIIGLIAIILAALFLSKRKNEPEEYQEERYDEHKNDSENWKEEHGELSDSEQNKSGSYNPKDEQDGGQIDDFRDSEKDMGSNWED